MVKRCHINSIHVLKKNGIQCLKFLFSWHVSECPVCREPFNADSLIENVFVRKHVAGTEDGTEGDQLCTGCESHPSTSYCLQCDDWLCNDCVDAHKRVRMTKDHQLTSREEAADKGRL